MKKITYIVFFILGISLYSKAEKETEAYILLLNSSNFGEAWSDVLYSSLSKGLQEENIRIYTEELVVPVMPAISHRRMVASHTPIWITSI